MLWFWLGFLSLIALFLALDLGVFHRKNKTVSMIEGLTWAGVWATTALLFSGFVYYAYEHHWMGLGTGLSNSTAAPIDGAKAWSLFITCYVLEWSLSVDNLFVIALIFGYFKIPGMYQHRVLFWGIMGAIVMRGICISLGAALVANFEWILYVFGVFLIFTAWKMLMSDDDPDPSKSRVVRFVYRHFRVTQELHGPAFTVKIADETGEVKRWLTPLALALIVVEATDLIFAVDSIPAAFGVVQDYPDSFLIFTSNIFAILGLRSMYFALAGLLSKFHYLKVSLAVILGLVGVKMLAGHWLKSQSSFLHDNISFITLGMVLILLACGVLASLVIPAKEKETEAAVPPEA